MLDIGCGERQLKSVLGADIQYIALDYPATIDLGYASKPQVFGDAHCLPFASDSVDTVLMLDVLEHLAQPEVAMGEVWRTLKTGGAVIVEVPFMYPLHDEPYDYQRWSEHGLRVLFERHGLNVKAIRPYGEPAETAAALLAVALVKHLVDAARQRKFAVILAPLFLIAVPCINIAGWLLARIAPGSSFMPLGYRVTGIKTG